jgi:hypothetical protein
MLFPVRPADGGMLDEVVHLMLVFIVEGRDSNDHLIEQDAQGPPIQGVIVA